jgi:hypothetical protein
MIRIPHFVVPGVLGLLLILAACDAEQTVGVDMVERSDGVDQTVRQVRLVSICEAVWRLDNLTGVDHTVTWDHVASGQQGEVEVPAEQRLYFRSPHASADANTTRLYLDGVQQDVKASNNTACTYQLTGTVFNDANGDGLQGGLETGLAALTVRLFDNQQSLLTEFKTAADGSYEFPALVLAYGSSYIIDVPASTNADDNNEAIIPYYGPSSPSSLPHAFEFAFPTGLENVGDVAESFGAESLTIGLTLDPVELKSAFDSAKLPRDLRNDHFWWQEMKRALTGPGAQRNAKVKKHELVDLLDKIQNGGPGINPFYADPFTFGRNPIAEAERILRPPANRNSQQPDFLSALLTVWLNRVYDTSINTVLLDGLLLAAEQSYNAPGGPTPMQMAVRDAASATRTIQLAAQTLDTYTSTLRSTYRSGSGGIGSN